ncbi:probable ATP-dependent RNA helicase DDX20 [Gordionus sp. m RMFG-2023]|uniref:probable ATP-dependent RNA helicase DDX20 n=1 Tax=Gordionus sp. m RMFG-2023 TaxID=3053472 RepID=UPI0031FBAE67
MKIPAKKIRIRLAHDFESLPRTDDVKLELNEHYSNFEKLHLSPETITGLFKCGFHFLTPIQQKAIPLGRMGVDLILQSKAGTGKTCVFTVIALETINFDILSPQVIILVPSREIAFQIKIAILNIGQGYSNLKVACFVGGYKIKDKENSDDKLLELYSSHIIIGTPSRIKHFMYLKLINLQMVKLFIIDEVDQIFRVKEHEEMINWIYSSLAKTKQIIITSATYSNHLIKIFYEKYMNMPLIIRIDDDDVQLKG